MLLYVRFDLNMICHYHHRSSESGEKGCPVLVMMVVDRSMTLVCVIARAREFIALLFFYYYLVSTIELNKLNLIAK